EHLGVMSMSVVDDTLTAIERFNGAYGMDVLVAAAVKLSGLRVGENVYRTFERITEQTLEKNGADAQAEILAWWKANGEEFVRERRARKEKGDGLSSMARGLLVF